MWIKNINRKEWTPGPGARVCSMHFSSGKPASPFDNHHPDWVPQLHMGYELKGDNVSKFQRYERFKRRLNANSQLQLAPPCIDPPPLPLTPLFNEDIENQSMGNIASSQTENQCLGEDAADIDALCLDPPLPLTLLFNEDIENQGMGNIASSQTENQCLGKMLLI